MKRFLASISTAVVLIAGGAAAAGPATASPTTSYPLAFTGGLGAYPRFTPNFDARTGTAVPEGTGIDASCWVHGGDVTNPSGYTSSVWVQDTSGAFWPEAWLDTGSSGVPEGLASCAAPQTAPAQPAEPVEQPVEQPAWQPNCSPGGPYIDGTITTTTTDTGVRISLTPTMEARNAGWWDRQSTVEMWHAIQACVPGLYDQTADSVWQQLECHQAYAWLTWPDGTYGTGPTYDLEAWVDPLMTPGWLTYGLSRCLGSGFDPATGLTFFAATE